MRRMRHASGCVPLLLLCGWAAPSAARQHAQDAGVRLGATAIALWTFVDPALAGESRNEAAITRPMLVGHAHALDGRLAAHATVNLEGWTLRRGEMAPGNHGEGYVDRRHPHTYLHEAIAVVRSPAVGLLEGSLAVGRGFVPFGTDDPMVRPFTKYPTNHHLAQVLERIVAIGAVRAGPAMLEAGLFNGDEPTRPSDLGRTHRFGDSWSLRGTVLPAPWLELQASRAFVESPEHVLGDGLDQRKWSASARVERPLGGDGSVYALAEWARTDDRASTRTTFGFHSLLAEAAAARGDWTVASRVERTTRPEEERLRDPFRSVRPHTDDNVVGITRWWTVTAHARRRLHHGGLTAEPFIEVAHHHVRETTGSIFDPLEFYGADRIWTISVGGRIAVGAEHQRMGRYGVALPAAPAGRPGVPAHTTHDD